MSISWWKSKVNEMLSAREHCLRFAITMPRELGRICDCHRVEADGLCTCSCDGDVCACSCPGCQRAGSDASDVELTATIMDNAAAYKERIGVRGR